MNHSVSTSNAFDLRNKSMRFDASNAELYRVATWTSSSKHSSESVLFNLPKNSTSQSGFTPPGWPRQRLMFAIMFCSSSSAGSASRARTAARPGQRRLSGWRRWSLRWPSRLAWRCWSHRRSAARMLRPRPPKMRMLDAAAPVAGARPGSQAQLTPKDTSFFYTWSPL